MSASIDSTGDLKGVLDERAPEVAEDPRVGPTLRIGGIGHRHIEPAQRPRVQEAVAGVLRCMHAAAQSAPSAVHASDAYLGQLDLFAITPLAEGADRIVARTALENGYRLGAILPLSLAEYEATFDASPDMNLAVSEFRDLLAECELPKGYGVLVLDGDATEDGKLVAFRECARAVVRWSDILITILRADRQSSETGLTVREAIKRGMTTVLIDPRSPEHLRIAVNGALLRSDADVEGELRRAVIRLIGGVPPAQHRTKGSDLATFREEEVRCDVARRCDYEFEGPYAATTVAPRWISWCTGLNGAVAKQLRGGKRASVLRAGVSDRHGPKFAHTLPFDAVTSVPFVQLFLHQHRADVLALAYSELHRSAQIVIGLLGVLAAALAVVGFFDARMIVPITVSELMTLLFALAIVRTAANQRWLERWVSYRFIAEVLRYAKYMMVCGRTLSVGDLGGSAETSAEHAWRYTYCRNVLRALRIAMPGRATRSRDDALATVRSYLANPCVESQITYHHRTARLRGAVATLLRRTAYAVAAITVACVSIKLLTLAFVPANVGHSVGLAAKLLTAIDGAAIFLPAMAGALLGLRGYGEHGVVSRRSIALVAALEQTKERIRSASSISELGEEMSTAGTLLLRDVDGWQEIFQDKRIEL